MSYSSDEADSVQSKQFRYIDLEKNVLIPAVNSRDIVFYTLDFDTNLNVWQLTLTDGEKYTTKLGVTDVQLSRLSVSANVFT